MAPQSSDAEVPSGYGTVTPWLISRDSAALIRFLESAFDAEEIAGSRMHNSDGSIAHVEIELGDSIVMLFDSYEGWPDLSRRGLAGCAPSVLFAFHRIRVIPNTVPRGCMSCPNWYA